MLKQALSDKPTEAIHKRPHWNKKTPVILAEEGEYSDYESEFMDRTDNGYVIKEALAPPQHAWAMPNFAAQGGDMRNEETFACWKVMIYKNPLILILKISYSV